MISCSPLLFSLSGLNRLYVPTICFTFYRCLTHHEGFTESWQLLLWPCAAGLVKSMPSVCPPTFTTGDTISEYTKACREPQSCQKELYSITYVVNTDVFV